MSRSSVDFPDPFAPIRPVRPGLKEALSLDSTTRPSGREKDKSFRTTDTWQLRREVAGAPALSQALRRGTGDRPQSSKPFSVRRG